MDGINFPKEWVLTKLGEVVDYGQTQKCEFADVSPNTWVLELEDIEKDSSKIIQRISASKRIFKSTKNKFKKGDVLYGKLRPYLNKVIIADNSGVCSTEIMPIDAGPYINNQFLLYWLKSETFLNYVNEVSYGVNMPRLGTQDALAAPLVLPSLAEQEVIAEKLTKLITQVEATKTSFEFIPDILKRFRQSTLIAAANGSLSEEWRIKNNIDTDHWNISSLGLVAEVTTGKTPRRNNKEFWENGTIPWLTSAATGETLTSSADQFVTEKAVKECSLKIFPKGTLLLAMYGEGKTRGQVTEILLSATCNQACAAILVDESKASKDFVKIILQKNYEEIRSAAVGGAQPNLNLSKVRDISFSLPSLEEQYVIINRVKQLLEFAESLEQRVNNTLERINKLTKSILSQAFRGELTSGWRFSNPHLIRGENSAESLLVRIRNERNQSKRQPVKKRSSVKVKAGSDMSKQIINVVSALKKYNKPLNGQQLLVACGYPNDCSTEELEKFFLDIREALLHEKTITKLNRSDDGQDWFALTDTEEKS